MEKEVNNTNNDLRFMMYYNTPEAYDPEICDIVPLYDGAYYEIRQFEVRGNLYYSADLINIKSGLRVNLGDALFRNYEDAQEVCRKDYDTNPFIDKSMVHHLRSS